MINSLHTLLFATSLLPMFAFRRVCHAVIINVGKRVRVSTRTCFHLSEFARVPSESINKVIFSGEVNLHISNGHWQTGLIAAHYFFAGLKGDDTNWGRESNCTATELSTQSLLCFLFCFFSKQNLFVIAATQNKLYILMQCSCTASQMGHSSPAHGRQGAFNPTNHREESLFVEANV